MASRLSDIRTAVKAHITTGFPGVTYSDTPVAFDTVPKNQFPYAMTLFIEDEPERIDFKQERRRVTGQAVIGILVGSGTITAAREVMDLGIQGVRDAIFADPSLTSTVDDVSVSAGVAYSGQEDSIVYGTIDIVTEEVF